MFFSNNIYFLCKYFWEFFSVSFSFLILLLFHRLYGINCHIFSIYFIFLSFAICDLLKKYYYRIPLFLNKKVYVIFCSLFSFCTVLSIHYSRGIFFYDFSLCNSNLFCFRFFFYAYYFCFFL